MRGGIVGIVGIVGILVADLLLPLVEDVDGLLWLLPKIFHAPVERIVSLEGSTFRHDVIGCLLFLST